MRPHEVLLAARILLYAPDDGISVREIRHRACTEEEQIHVTKMRCSGVKAERRRARPAFGTCFTA